MHNYYPEGRLIEKYDNKQSMKNLESLRYAQSIGKILEAKAIVCDNDHNLIVQLPFSKAIIPREEGAVGIADGSTKDIALLARVNKPVCFKVKEIKDSGEIILSRRLAQTECIENYISKLTPGDIIEARITHLEQFGCFVDIGCGISSLITIDSISVSRIAHPSDRFSNGDDIYAVVKSYENGRVSLSHKELLGTWEENSSLFRQGETVGGIIRSVEDYGVFVELSPNLAGLAEPFENAKPGQCASVYIKSIIPEKMKVKLIIVDVFDSTPDKAFNYFITSGKLTDWNYSTENCEKKINSHF
ncbi:MAG: 30S ribosomal protein S1 [Oscillospiraceae bacterium]|nr:30S ribosomal protein S1 [Oscillospiraceae bacterium]